MEAKDKRRFIDNKIFDSRIKSTEVLKREKLKLLLEFRMSRYSILLPFSL